MIGGLVAQCVERIRTHRRDQLDYLVELPCDLGLEVSLDLVNLGELGEGPAAVSFQIVHTGNPVDVHSRLLFLRVFAPVAFDLDDQVQQIIVAMAVINQHDEVW